MDEATAQRLGDKLSTLDLTEAEGRLLIGLMGATYDDGDDVSGFSMDKASGLLAQTVLERGTTNWSWGESNAGSIRDAASPQGFVYGKVTW